MSEKYWSIGLMSGTSLDGIDAAIILTDGEKIYEMGEFITLPFSAELRINIREAVYLRGDIAKTEHDLTIAHIEAVNLLLQKSGMQAKDIKVIGFHGQTIMHRPKEGITWQLGNGSLLAQKTAIDVVYDFRRRDIVAGGQGAPLVPLFHAALADGMDLPIIIVNIGGISNITFLGKNEIIAFDSGVGNVLLNEWVLEHTGKLYDEGGKLALAGKVNQEILAKYLSHSFFTTKPPKSLDRNDFSIELLSRLSIEDGASTLAALTAETIVLSQQYLPEKPNNWYICGGGRHNQAIMNELKKRLENVQPIEELGWQGDAIEAQAFAFLAVRSLKNLPLTLPTTTGVTHPISGGVFCSR